MTTSRQWQLEREGARRYRDVLEPTILGPFAEALVDRVGPEPGAAVVDVGCGTGAAAVAARRLVGTRGRVIGVDPSPAMIEVARERDGSIDWREAGAERLPIDDGTIDVYVCAHTLQFVPSRAAAIGEAARVTRRGGRAAISIWAPLAGSPYFDALVQAMSRHVGPDVAVGLAAAFRFTDAEEVLSLLRAHGFASATVTGVALDLDLPRLSAFVPRHIGATPMGPGYAAAPEEARRGVVNEVVGRLAASATPTPLRFRAQFIMAER